MKINYFILVRSLYEDQPDERHDAVPGCSSAVDDACIITPRRLYESNSSDSNITCNSTPNTTNKKRRISRSQETVSSRYAETLTRNYEKIQDKILAENRCVIEKMMETEKELVRDMLVTQQTMLRDTTTQLLNGFKEILASTGPSTASTSLSFPATSSQFSPSYSSNSLPRHVILNLRNPETLTVQQSIQQIFKK